MEITKTNFGDLAKERIEELHAKNFKFERKELTTSQIRGILDLVNKVYNRVATDSEEKLSSDVLSDLAYIKVKIAYSSGRSSVVKNFITHTNFTENLSDVLKSESKTNFLLFARYVESLVAYFKFYGGKN
ncbi:hypothetical protein Hs30E_00480 [Lactococcus hodotermopsidis]|uniref:CRISPR system Cms protein Csm2 n=1 Tax=Pseudolactococcus hodotermopsidis TaxID=2709157 RepID=A0A6A0BCF0_9LACT|nr:type III-A CRISPR-associated protein Csm2 [Lactococcus hodotermopsidis]GFH41497.1 hypothetical protein Hs30E_00480 [Lactococcus hodotermopsidis]